MAFRKGYRAESDLVHFLQGQGFYAIRIPVSGGRFFPCDILAAKGEDRRAYQVKETEKNHLYVPGNVVKEFIEVCHKLGFKPIFAIRWKRKRGNPWTFLEVTEGKSLKINRPI